MSGDDRLDERATYLQGHESEYERLSAEYETVFHGCQSPLFLVDVEYPGPVFRYRKANRANERITQYKSEEIVGLTLRELHGERIGSDIEKHFRQCAEQKIPVSYIAERTYDNKSVVLQVALTPLINDGRVTQIVGSYYDISELAAMKTELRDSEEKYRALFHNANDPIALYKMNRGGPPGLFIEVNDALCRLTGYSREEMLRLSPADLDDPAFVKDVYPQVKKQLLEKGRATFEMLIITKNGAKVPVEISSHAFTLRGEEVVVAVTRDVTDRKKAELELKHRLEIEHAVSEVFTLLLIDEEPDYTRIVSVLGQAVRAGRCHLYLTDNDGETMVKTAEWYAPEARGRFEFPQSMKLKDYRWFVEKLKLNGIAVIPDTDRLPHPAAEVRDFFLSLGAKSALFVPIVSPAGEMLGLLGFADAERPRQWFDEDIRLLNTVAQASGAALERKRAVEKIRYLSIHDRLTGLYNMEFFDAALQRFDTEKSLPLSVIISDVNGLKLVNDVFGHQKGDELLVKAAGILRKSCRDAGIIARWGGDEFIILLPNTAEADALRIAQRISQTCSEIPDRQLSFTLASGVATKNSSEQSIKQVIKEAEDWMYRHKLLESKSARSTLVSSLEKLLWEKDFETEEHAKRMQDLALRMGKALGLTQNQLDELALLAALHDIGKVAVPNHILSKPDSLNQQERDIMCRHPEVGYRIAMSTPELATVAETILAHHEHYDGSGYPQGLKGDAIPLAARIISIIDAYDVMTHDRPYRSRITQADAVAELRRQAGKQFDPRLVECFIKMIG